MTGERAPGRRLVIAVCRHERGVVGLPVERGRARRRLNADGVRRELQALVSRRRLDDVVSVRDACAGGCQSAGPNVSVTMYPLAEAGERPSQVAVGWKTYVYSIRTLACLATIIEDNLGGARARRPRAR